MITARKIRTLKPRVQIRKAADIFHQASVSFLDSSYLEEVLSIALESELVSEELKEKLAVFFSKGDSVSFDDISYSLLDALGDVPADWDAVDRSGNVDWSSRTVFSHHLYLDHLRSPYNVGSIFRSAEAFGIESIIIAPGTASPDHPRARRTSRSASDGVEWREGDIPDNLPVFALETGGCDITEFSFPSEGICIIGSEETGITPESREKALSSLGIVSIRQYGAKGSINVASASAILMSHWAYASPCPVNSGKAP